MDRHKQEDWFDGQPPDGKGSGVFFGRSVFATAKLARRKKLPTPTIRQEFLISTCARCAVLVNLVTAALLLMAAQPLRADDDDARFLAGLRERRLFELAATYCHQRLAEAQLSAADRVQLTVDLIRVYAEHALNSGSERRESLWQLARDAAAEFHETDRPRAVLVRVQDALTLLARGELARMESEIASQSSDPLAAARETLRQAATLLNAIDRELAETIPIRRSNPLRPEQLSAEELVSLQNHVRYQLARAYKNQALCFPAGSSDRTASLTAAIDQLQQPLLQLDPSQSLYVALRLEQIVCLRLLADVDGAGDYLNALHGEELSPADQLSVRAERIRLHLARADATAALQVLEDGRKIGNTTSAELDFAFLETYVTLWKAAADRRDQEESSRWRDKSVAAASYVEQEHGPYWARRAEILLVRIAAGSGDGSVEILRRTADDLYRKGNLEDAVAAYDKAAAAAIEAAAPDESFELSYKAALVWQQQQRYAEAAARFQRLALAQQSHPHAANSHLLAIVNTRQASAAAGKWLDSYPELLREHLANWPDNESASTAAYWLGELEAGRRRWGDAIEALTRVASDSAYFSGAIERLGECWLLRLEGLGADEPSRNEEVERAAGVLVPVIVGEDGQVPTEWSTAARQAVVALAAIRLRYGANDLPETENLLKASLSGLPEPDAAWRVAAHALLVGIMARQPGREDDAREMLSQVGAASTKQLFELFQQIAAMMDSAAGSARTGLAELIGDIAKQLESKRTELDGAQQLSLDRTLARAVAATGDTPGAYERFQQLARDHPDHGAIQEEYAQFLLDSGDPAHWRQALDQWRRIAARTRPRTPRWFRAKYAVALAQYKLNDKASAAQLIRYLQATEDLEPSGLGEAFNELLKRCRE